MSSPAGDAGPSGDGSRRADPPAAGDPSRHDARVHPHPFLRPGDPLARLVAKLGALTLRVVQHSVDRWRDRRRQDPPR